MVVAENHGIWSGSLILIYPSDIYIYIQCDPPSDVSWFRFAPVTIVIGTINHSYWSYKPT